MRRSRASALLMSALLSVFLTGCWDRQELEAISFVLALAVDKGRENTFTITAAVALPEKLAGGGGEGGGGKPYSYITVEAPTIAGALTLMDNLVGHPVSLMHTKTLFMSDELARISGMWTMDELTRFRQARSTIHYVVTGGRAGEFLKQMESTTEKDPTKVVEHITNTHRYTALLPAASQIHHFVTSVNTGYTSPLTYYAALDKPQEVTRVPGGAEIPAAAATASHDQFFRPGQIPKEGAGNFEMIGAAAFRRDKMVGTLSGEEVRYVLLLQDRFRRAFFSVPDPHDKALHVSLDIQRHRPVRISFDPGGGHPRVRALVTLEAEIVAIQANRDYTNPEMQAELEASFAREVERGIRAVVRKTQAWESDVAGLGRTAVRHFPTVEAWEAYGWPARYKEADFDVTVQVNLRRFGLQLSPPELVR